MLVKRGITFVAKVSRFFSVLPNGIPMWEKSMSRWPRLQTSRNSWIFSTTFSGAHKESAWLQEIPVKFHAGVQDLVWIREHLPSTKRVVEYKG